VDALVALPANGAPEMAWGDSFFFYDPDRTLAANRFPFATIVTKDYTGFDEASNLNRSGIFRLNLGVDKATFQSLFGTGKVAADYDYTALDKTMPHPIYASQFWVSVLNPSDATFQQDVMPLLNAAYDFAVERQAKRAI
jgi:hypothetical protein